MKKSLLLATASAMFLFSHAATAQEHLAISAGAFDVDDNAVANFGLEYRGAAFWHGLKPIAGVQSTTDGDVYGYAGLQYDWQFADSWYLAPNLAVGLYEDGDVDLGGAVEFRSGIELGYQFSNAHRVGVAVHHLSNAGIYDKNPGAEQVMVTYSIPVGLFQ